MAEILSPGIFIEEVPAQVQVIQAVSTSNLGAIGFTQKGPTDVATLVTSFENFSRTFGPIIPESFLPLSMAAFYSNGGRRAFVVRVVPSDAVSADALIDSQQTDQQIETGDGSNLSFVKTATTSLLKDNSGASPLIPGSVTFSWRAEGTPVVTESVTERDGATTIAMAENAVLIEFRIATASLEAFDAEFDQAVQGTVSIIFDPDGGGDETIVVPAGEGSPVVTTVPNAAGSVVTFDHRTGFGSLELKGADVPDAMTTGDLRISYTPTEATLFITDDGVGGFPVGSKPELSTPGSIDYTDGSYDFQVGAGEAPAASTFVLATYGINAWDLDPISDGAWGNDMRTTVEGDADFFTASTASFSRYRFNVLLLNDATGTFDIIETYEQLSFSDPLDAQFFPDVLNELSDLVSVNEPAGNEAPLQLSGIARSEVIGGGDESGEGKSFTVTPNHVPIAKRSVSIAFTNSSGDAQTITDDGTGNLTGNVDGAATNTINYTTGVMIFSTLDPIDATTLVTLTYREAAAETTHTEDFSGGSNGTFSSGTYGRNQFTSFALLSADSLGMFALNRVEELMQLIVPDFVGDIVITGDILDYVDGRATQPSGGDRFAILQPPVGSDPQEAVDWFRFDLVRFSKFAALYWPHVRVADPLADNRPKTMPVVGHVAGIYARTDSTKNVGKAPGGTVDGSLRFLTGLELIPTQAERDFVYPNKINPLISSPQTGLAVWGVRTIAQESEWRYINVRRLFMFLEKSVFNATHWIVFENNGPALWARIKAQLGGFLNNLFNEGLFAGGSPSEAFFVIVDESNNDASSIALGQVIIDIGVAANTPAEFVRFRFQQITLA